MSQIEARFLQKEAQKQPVPSEAQSSLNEQMAFLDLCQQHNLFWEITPERFPGIPPPFVELYRFYAMNNAIESVQTARQIVQNPAVLERLDVWMTDMVKDRDARLLEGLSSIQGQPDQSVIGKQTELRRNSDHMRWFNQLIELGLVEEINPRKFPELTTLSERSRVFLQLRALGNRRAILEDQIKQTGLGGGLDPHPQGKSKERLLLEAELMRAQKAYEKVLEQYLRGSEDAAESLE